MGFGLRWRQMGLFRDLYPHSQVAEAGMAHFSPSSVPHSNGHGTKLNGRARSDDDLVKMIARPIGRAVRGPEASDS